MPSYETLDLIADSHTPLLAIVALLFIIIALFRSQWRLAGRRLLVSFGGAMQYMKLNAVQREELLAALGGMSVFLRKTFSSLNSEQIRIPGPNGAFSPVEQVWHLADLEREGFGERIRRLLAESEPHLPDFDGTKAAAERNYRSLSLEAGLRAFAEARRKNLAALQAVDSQSWYRTGKQEGLGDISLCDMPGFMLQHDSAHKIEIEAWKKFIGGN